MYLFLLPHSIPHSLIALVVRIISVTIFRHPIDILRDVLPLVVPVVAGGIFQKVQEYVIVRLLSRTYNVLCL